MSYFSLDTDEKDYLFIPDSPYLNSNSCETELNLEILREIKETYTKKIKDNNRILIYDDATYMTFVYLIDMVLYLSERVKVLEQEKEHFYGQ